MTLTRRTLLSRLAHGTGALALAPLLAGATERKFKIGVCEWSLGKSDPSSFDLAKVQKANLAYLRTLFPA
jgi:hypothetical protein